MQIVLASNNRGKALELTALLAHLNLTIVPQSDLGVMEIEETGATFIENAILKARHASGVTGLPALADDSGLCIKALAGKPGIKSARFAGEHANSEANIQKVLQALASVTDRSAYFHCSLVFLLNAADPAPLIAEGEWSGMITNAPSGANGFGYDPIFFIPEYKLTAAELTSHVKNGISHRGKAIQVLLKRLPEKISGL